MKLTPRRVLALWRRDAAWRGAFHEVRRALDAKKTQAPALQTVLEGLVRDGTLAYLGNRYQLAALPAPVRSPRRERSAPPTPDETRTGVFSAHPDGYGFVTTAGEVQAVFIPPRRVGGALDGDVVRAGLVRKRGDNRLSGHILDVVERRRTTLQGFVQHGRGETWVMPLNPKIPAVFIEPGGPGAPPAEGRLVEAAFTEYPEDSRTAPSGRILREIENPDSPAAITGHILNDLRIPATFSPAAEQAAAALARTPPSGQGPGRRQLTALPFVTIDGADARDFDDAVCLEKIGAGYRLWVAIADVAEFVGPGTPLDTDGFARGTSVYFPAQVVPMLPEPISNDQCSLRPGEPRLALTCEMELDPAGEMQGYALYESLIQSHARLTYTQVADFFASGEAQQLGPGAAYGPMLRNMLALSEVLSQRRGRRGALDFVFPEARFMVDAEGLPVEILRALPNAATRLIEQFMLEANETVARHCTENGIPILHRVHDPPPPDQVTSACEQLQALGVGAKTEEFATPAGVKRVLARAVRNQAWEQVELVILKSMSQAQYRPLSDGHFGLAAPHYAHFTSPIRRFPDLLLHRALKNSFHGRPPQTGLPPLAPAGVHLSERERAAGEAENRMAKLYRVLLMEHRLGEIFEATVSGMTNRGLWIALTEPFVEGFVPLTGLPGSNFRMDARRNILRGVRGVGEIRIGQRLTAQLARADRLTQELEFALQGWPAADV